MNIKEKLFFIIPGLAVALFILTLVWLHFDTAVTPADDDRAIIPGSDTNRMDIALNTNSKTITVATGLSVEPYVIKSNDSGFEVDIVREIFALEGYRAKFIYQPLKRTKVSFMRKLVDGVMTIKKQYPEIKESFVSDTYITYHNYALSLSSKKLKINTVADLADKSIISFQQSSLALGKEFEAMTKKNSRYREMANQRSQVAMFFAKHIDVIVLDYKIFKYHRNRLENLPIDLPVAFHRLFKPSNYCMAFRESTMRDVFNKGLKKIKKSGRYKKIIDSYLNKNIK
ncbi:MAG: amino acid ABC transporter substrate-binding protein [bacterium]|nr:amino acid ABC transporter substrate-binding protein [bacterium]